MFNLPVRRRHKRPKARRGTSMRSHIIVTERSPRGAHVVGEPRSGLIRAVRQRQISLRRRPTDTSGSNGASAVGS